MKIKLILAFAFLSICIPAFGRSGARNPVGPTQDDSAKYKTESFNLDNFQISGAYPAMTGPTKKRIVTLGASKDAKYLWVKGVSVSVFSKEKKEEPLGLLCHAWITLGDKKNYMTNNEALLTISEGMGQSLFPKGYGMYLENGKDNDIELLAQALNDNPHFNKNLGYRFSVTYLEDKASKPSLLKALKQISFSAVGPAVKFKDGEMCQAEDGAGEGQAVHFVVPPGRHDFKRLYPKGTFTQGDRIHFIKVHLHQYGQEIALYDRSANKMLWRGLAHYEKNQIESVDFYSDEKGLSMDPEHEYEIIGTYNNPTSKNVDGMAVLRMYRSAI